MKVFISWSGDLSLGVAEIMRDMLPLILQGTDPIMSKRDLESGARWGKELAEHLESASFGIFCLTPDNLGSDWLLFEAGALTKHIDAHACGLLLGGLSAATVKGPLAQFQHRQFSEEDTGALLRDMNNQLPSPLTTDAVDQLFGKFWPDMSARYESLVAGLPEAAAPPTRSDREIIEEILETVRRIERVSVGPLSARGDHEDLDTFQLEILERINAGLEVGPHEAHSFVGLIRLGLVRVDPDGRLTLTASGRSTLRADRVRPSLAERDARTGLPRALLDRMSESPRVPPLATSP